MAARRKPSFISPVDTSSGIDVCVLVYRYYQEILHPMDLSTMQVKLNNGAYHFQQEINDDFDQIVTNCKIFNPPGTLPIAHAEAMQRYYWSEVNKLGKLSYQEKRALQGMMNRLRQKP